MIKVKNIEALLDELQELVCKLDVGNISYYERTNQYKDLDEYFHPLYDLVNTLNQPTLSECIKEWEEKGFSYSNEDDDFIHFENNKIDETNGFIITFDLKNIMYCCRGKDDIASEIDIELHNLIGKTLKALEVENNE